MTSDVGHGTQENELRIYAYKDTCSVENDVTYCGKGTNIPKL